MRGKGAPYPMGLKTSPFKRGPLSLSPLSLSLSFPPYLPLSRVFSFSLLFFSLSLSLSLPISLSLSLYLSLYLISRAVSTTPFSSSACGLGRT